MSDTPPHRSTRLGRPPKGAAVRVGLNVRVDPLTLAAIRDTAHARGTSLGEAVDHIVRPPTVRVVERTTVTSTHKWEAHPIFGKRCSVCKVAAGRPGARGASNICPGAPE